MVSIKSWGTYLPGYKLPRKKMGTASELLEIIKLLSSTSAGMFCGSMITADGGEGKTYERI